MQEVTIIEYKEKELESIDPRDIDYLEKEIENGKFTDKIEVLRDPRTLKFKVRNKGAFVGMIYLPHTKTTLKFIPKREMKFPNIFLINYLDEKSMVYDPTLFTKETEETGVFLEILAKIFINEVDELIKKGILKKHVRVRENQRYMKGKFLPPKQIKHNLVRKDRFFCEYQTLTFNNLENKAILYVAQVLMVLSKNPKTDTELNKISTMLSQLVAYEYVHPESLRRIRWNRLNDHYKGIIEICEYVLRRVFNETSGKTRKKGKQFNFLLDMNSLYEAFVTEILREVLSEEFEDVIIEDQKRIRGTYLVVKGKKFTLKPDILVKKNGRTAIVADIKYKTSTNNPDFYQMLTYVFTLGREKPISGILIYEQIDESSTDKAMHFSCIDPLGKNDKKAHILYWDLRLSEFFKNNNNFKSFRQFKSKVKEYLRNSEGYVRLKRLLKEGGGCEVVHRGI